jgi:D-amino peptidase
MAGTANAPLCHTYSSKTIEYYKINGEFVGEFGARAMMAGTLGVPTVFIAGDDKAVAEAHQLVPEIHAATVKWGLGIESALHLSPTAARDLIRKVASEAIQDIGNIALVIIDPPYRQEIRVKQGVSIKPYLEKGFNQIDERTVLLHSENICDLLI